MKLMYQLNPLLGAAESLFNGFQLFQGELAFLGDPGLEMQTDLDQLRQAMGVHDKNDSMLTRLRLERDEAFVRSGDLLATCVSILRPILGRQWNGFWKELGFKDGSLRLPTRYEDRLAMLTRMEAYLEAHPPQAIIPMGFTAANATVIRQELVAKRTAVENAHTLWKTSAENLERAARVLQKRIRSAKAMLDMKLGPEDPRWNAFGLPLPIERSKPSVPVELIIRQINGQSVVATWSRATRAARYRLFIQAEGEAEPRAVATVKGLLAEIAELPQNVKLTFTVTAANFAGESQPSEPVEFTLKGNAE